MENADKVRMHFIPGVTLIIRSDRGSALSTSSWIQSGGRGQNREKRRRNRNKRKSFITELIKAENC